MIYRGRPCLTFFSSVVKNVANPNIGIKKLVYIYLLQYAEAEPDLALLSINTIQKSLSDQSPKVRAMALRTMSGIRVPVISQIVSLAIKKGCGDLSPLVRKAAALAIPKCYRLDPNTLPQLTDNISILLGDRQYFVAGAAIVAMNEVCPDRIDLLHKHYRALVKKLVDMDEWSQLATLQLLTQYARRCFPLRFGQNRQEKGRDFYESEPTPANEDKSGSRIRVIDPDLDLLLRTCRALLQSRNTAVVLSVARCYQELGTAEDIQIIAGPMIALLRSTSETREVAMRNVVKLCQLQPRAFAGYVLHFLVLTTDPLTLVSLKFQAIATVFKHCPPPVKGFLLSELSYLSQSSSQEVVQEAVRAIGHCAQSDLSVTARCMNMLLSRLSSQQRGLAAEALSVLRHLIHKDPDAHEKTIVRLAKNLDTASDPGARATVIWLVGEYTTNSRTSDIAPDVLRLLVKGFPSEHEKVKMQILLLAAKVYLLHQIKSQAGPSDLPEESEAMGGTNASIKNHSLDKLWTHLLLLVRYDTSFDLRDRMRTYRSLLSNPESTQLASLLLQTEKPVPDTESHHNQLENEPLGSTTLLLGQESRLPRTPNLPDWVREGDEPNPKLRESEVPAIPSASKSVAASATLAGPASNAIGKQPTSTQKGTRSRTLNDWLDETSEEEAEETEESSDEEAMTEEDNSDEDKKT